MTPWKTCIKCACSEGDDCGCYPFCLALRAEANAIIKRHEEIERKWYKRYHDAETKLSGYRKELAGCANDQIRMKNEYEAKLKEAKENDDHGLLEEADRLNAIQVKRIKDLKAKLKLKDKEIEQLKGIIREQIEWRRTR